MDTWIARSIAGIEVVPLRVPLKPGLPGATLWSEKLSSADSLLVKETTDDSMVGWAEAFGRRGASLAAHALVDLITPLCLGRDADDGRADHRAARIGPRHRSRSRSRRDQRLPLRRRLNPAVRAEAGRWVVRLGRRSTRSPYPAPGPLGRRFLL